MPHCALKKRSKRIAINFQWYQRQLRAQSYKDISSVTLINDLTGSLFSLLFPLCASYPIDILFYADNPYVLDVWMSIFKLRAGSLQTKTYIKLMQDIIQGGLLEKQQDLIIIPSVLDYPRS